MSIPAGAKRNDRALCQYLLELNAHIAASILFDELALCQYLLELNSPDCDRSILSMGMIYISEHIFIEENEIHEEFIHASGPGGQNVNKVATAVQLRFDVADSPSLPDDVRERLNLLAGRRLTKEGILIINACRYRTQEQNRQDALNRLIELICKAVEKPKPRRKKKISAASKQRRLEAKRRKSEVKQMRRFDPGKED